MKYYLLLIVFTVFISYFSLSKINSNKKNHTTLVFYKKKIKHIDFTINNE